MELLIDTDALVRGIEAAGASGIAFFGYLMKKGYIQVWLKKIYLALRTSLEEITALEAQNGNALDKLNTPDDVLCVLNSFEVNADGKIVLKGHGRVNTLLTLDRPLTYEEMEEVIRVVKKILLTCKE